MSLGIDLGNYRTSVASEYTEWSALTQRQNHFISWVATDQDRVVVGDAAQSIAIEQGYDQVYCRFINHVEQSDSNYWVAGQQVKLFDLVGFLFKKAQYLASNHIQADTVLAVPNQLKSTQKLALLACAKKQGFQVKAILQQSFAKALALLHRENFKLGTVFALYDWEDDSFNFSIYRVISRYGIEILSSQSNDQVHDFALEQRIWFLISEKYKQLRGRDLTEEVLSQHDPRLKDCKTNLEKYGQASIEIRQYMIDLSLNEVSERTQDLVQQTIYKIDQALRQANLVEKDLNGGVYFLGTLQQDHMQSRGNSLIEQAKDYFTTNVFMEDGLGLAAKGASLFAQYYLTQSAEYRVQINDIHHESIFYLDRALHYYGIVTSIYDPQIKQDKDQNFPLIAKGQRLPVQYVQRLHTDEAGQVAVEVQFTTATLKTENLEKVEKWHAQRIEFSHSAQKLVELSLTFTLDVDHRLSCNIKNTFTGEERDIEQYDPVLGKYQYWRDPLIAVQ